MPYFSYSGYDAKGKQTKGTIEASSSVQAVERLTERGVVVVDVAVAEGCQLPAVNTLAYRL